MTRLNLDRQSSLKAGGGGGGYVAHSTCWQIILKMIYFQPFSKRVITAEIKTDKNAYGAKIFYK